MEIDLHIHSHRSNDSLSRPRDIVERAVVLGLGAIAVTDHNSWKGISEISAEAAGRILVIPGAEVKTDKGDVLALFIENEFPAREYLRVVEEIRAHDGICIIPHPADSTKFREEDLALADGLEYFNSRCTPKSNSRAASFVSRLRKPGFSSSDAHIVRDIGKGTTVVDDCGDLESLRKVILRNPEPKNMIRSSRLLHVMNEALVFARRGLSSRQA